MNCEQTFEGMPEYIDRSLPPAVMAQMEAHIAQCPACQQELHRYQTLFSLFSQTRDVALPPDMDTRFEQLLLENSPQKSLFRPRLWRYLGTVAAACLLLFLGWWTGQQTARWSAHEQRLQRLEMQAQPTATQWNNLQQPSASRRLAAVQQVAEMVQPDSLVLAALVHRLANDSHENVRLAAVHALARFGQYPQVRDALLAALTQQTDPMIQIAIIDALVSWNESRAIAPLERLVQHDSLMQMVKYRAEEGLGQLQL